MGGGCGDAFGRTGDDDLARGVVVGDPHVGVGPPAGDIDLLVVEAEYRGHRARVLEPSIMHRIGAGDDEANAVVEAERPSGGQGGVLAKAVPCAVARFDAEPFGGIEDHQARHEGRQLSVAGIAQLVGVGVEEQFADVTLSDLARLADELPTLVVGPRPAHPRTLRPLSGKREGEHHLDSRRRITTPTPTRR